MKTYYFWLCVVVGALLAACCPQGVVKQGSSGIKPFEVKLEVTEVQGNTVLQNKNPKSGDCDKFPNQDKYRKGCIVADLNQTVDVRFKLSGSGAWNFTTFQICSASDLKKPADFSTCTLSDIERADWLVLTKTGSAMPGSDGVVDIAGLDEGLSQFRLLDLNLIEADYFYRVQVCEKKNDTDASSPTCLWTDPGGQNKGRK